MIDTQSPFRAGDGLPPAEAREVDRLLAAGLLVPVLLDVVVAADAPADRRLRAAALRLVLPDRLRDHGAVVAQEAAAWLWCGGPPPRFVDLVVAPGLRRATAAQLVVHERRMPPDDVEHVSAGDEPAGVLAVTTTVRTVADLLRTLPAADAPAAASRVVEAFAVDIDDVAACLDRMPRARGVARARRLLRPLAAGRGSGGRPGQSIRLPVTR